jgi:hypothetical protein
MVVKIDEARKDQVVRVEQDCILFLRRSCSDCRNFSLLDDDVSFVQVSFRSNDDAAKHYGPILGRNLRANKEYEQTDNAKPLFVKRDHL